MPGWSKQAVLGLYRSLLRKGRQLTLTDKDFYYSRIRSEFERNRDLESLEEKTRQFEVRTRAKSLCNYFFLLCDGVLACF